MPLRYELEPTQFVLRVYDDDGDSYVASATIRIYGDRAWMSQISSPRLYQAMPEYFEDLLDRLNVVSLEGYMSKTHARAVRLASRGWAKFEITHMGKCAGREMPWVRISRLEAQRKSDETLLVDAGIPASD